MRPGVKKWTKAEERKLRKLYPRSRTADLVTKFKNRSLKAIGSRAKILGIKKRGWHKHWTPAELKKLRKLYPNTAADKLAKLFKCTKAQIYNRAHKLRLKKTAEFISNIGRNPKFAESGKKHRFPKGHVPLNKGVKGWYSGGRSSETWFKPGVRQGAAAEKWKPVGTHRYSKEGYLQIKHTDKGPFHRRWKAVHTILWEKHNGPVPPGHAVAFKDGNKKNIVIENLELISRAELCRRNTIHRYPPEVKDAIRHLAGFNRRIRTMEKKRNERKQSQNRRFKRPSVRNNTGTAG